jgi:hypothetical protein
MKLQEIKFKTPVKILQIFKNINLYGKADKSLNNRKEVLRWNEIQSKSGYTSDGELYLPETILKNPDFKTCDIITIEDNNQPETFSSNDLRFTYVVASNTQPQHNSCLMLRNGLKHEIFEVRKGNEMELFLNWDYFTVGTPERKSFKLCEIEMNKPVEIKINGKTDFSMSSRRARIFKEQHFIIHYIGDFNSCKLLKEPYASVLKKVPDQRKEVDLIKPLW